MKSEALSWSAAWRIARRDLSARFRGLRLLLVCLFLGVGALATIGTLTASIEREISTRGRAILGGDIEMTVWQRTPDKQEAAAFAALSAADFAALSAADLAAESAAAFAAESAADLAAESAAERAALEAAERAALSAAERAAESAAERAAESAAERAAGPR